MFVPLWADISRFCTLDHYNIQLEIEAWAGFRIKWSFCSVLIDNFCNDDFVERNLRHMLGPIWTINTKLHVWLRAFCEF